MVCQMATTTRHQPQIPLIIFAQVEFKSTWPRILRTLFSVQAMTEVITAVPAEETASAILLMVVNVATTDYAFHKRMKYCFTVSQAYSSIIYKDEHIMTALTLMAGKTPRKTMKALDSFVKNIAGNHQISVQLTVSLVVHSLTVDVRHILYQRVQELTAAWLNTGDQDLHHLLAQVKKGTIPDDKCSTTHLRSSPGIQRLAGCQSEQAFTNYYLHLYTCLTYSREGNLIHLQALMEWQQPHKYKQRDNEELMQVLSRERYKFTEAIRGCHLANMPSEIPTPVKRVANLQHVVLPTLWHATEDRFVFLDRNMLEMPYGEIVEGLAAQERRSNSQTTLSQFNASSSQPQRSTRSTDNNSRDARSKPNDRRSNKGAPTDDRRQGGKGDRRQGTKGGSQAPRDNRAPTGQKDNLQKLV